MGQVLIRNLPDNVIGAYKTKARLAGKSLEQVLRETLERNVPYTPEERAALSKEFLALSGGPHPPLSKDEYREGLE